MATSDVTHGSGFPTPVDAGLDRVHLDIRFPLADGRTLVQGPLTYNADGLATRHSADFVADPAFREAYAYGILNGRPDLHVEWRVMVALWCARHARGLSGHFVECGVHTGILSGAIAKDLDFGRLAPRRMFLFDTWAGIPEEQITEEERRLGIAGMNRKYQGGDGIYDAVCGKFAPWPNIELVRGMVPDTLQRLPREPIAYLSIDLNVASAEMDAIRLLWPRVEKGGWLVIDDYGWAAHRIQKEAWDEWAEDEGEMILPLPTGQGMVQKTR